MMNTKIAVTRHGKLYRILHWAIVAEVMLLLLSGLGVSEYMSLGIFSRGGARSLHVVAGLTWMGTITFFIYYFVVSGEYRWFGLSKLGLAFDFFMHEIKCAVNGQKIKNPVAYDAKRKKYLEKVVPTEVLAWWGWFALWFVMVFTGLGVLFPENFGIINRLCRAILPSFGNPAAAARLVHITVSMAVVVYMVIHAYAAWSFGMLGSMISGMSEEPAADAEKV